MIRHNLYFMDLIEAGVPEEYVYEALPFLHRRMCERAGHGSASLWWEDEEGRVYLCDDCMEYVPASAMKRHGYI